MKGPHFMVRVAVLPEADSIDELYDLKGSTAGRTTPLEQRTSPMTALKDLDLDRSLVLQDNYLRSAGACPDGRRPECFLTTQRLLREGGGWRRVTVKRPRQQPAQPVGREGHVCPARYLCVQYPGSSLEFILTSGRRGGGSGKGLN